MRILIVDDTRENLDAAKKAALSFPEHEFIFTNSAKEAADMIDSVDMVISDLFFPDENHNDGSNLDDAYAIYRSRMDDRIFEKVIDYYYGGDRSRAHGKLADACALLAEGTIRHAVESLIKFFLNSKWGKDNVGKYQAVLNNLPDPQFAYGGALILFAKELGKKHCLVSSIHRHAGNYQSTAGAIDAMTVLLPLMAENIVTVEQVQFDGNESLTYLGHDEIYQIGEDEGKTNSLVWEEAIRRSLQQ